MQGRWIALLMLTLAGLSAGVALAADFTQAPRDVASIKDCRRQDHELNVLFGDILQPGASFHHLGSFKVQVHRDGLDRQLWLIPVKSLPYTNIDELRAGARGNPLAIGALVVPYGQSDPRIGPGTYVLLYDGLRVTLVDAFQFPMNDFSVRLEIPQDGVLDPALGTVLGTAYGQANVTVDSNLELYVQCADEYGEALLDENGFVKIKFTLSIPGLASDDDSAARDLPTPKPDAPAE